MRYPVISLEDLHSFDVLLDKCIAAFPKDHQKGKVEYLHPSYLAPILYLQNARLLLHRQNLSQMAPPELRTNAINQCALIARETSHVMARCMQDPGNQYPNHRGTWKPILSRAASAFLCTHLWRCTLFLIFTADYTTASICARASATIGSARLINNACGRHLDFFLHALSAKSTASLAPDLMNDEEMIAYVSGDLQGSATQSWVWHGASAESAVSPSPLRYPLDSPNEGYSLVETPKHAPEALPAWTGWNRILDTLTRLAGKEAQNPVRASTQGPGLHTPGRISIADIM